MAVLAHHAFAALVCHRFTNAGIAFVRVHLQ